MAWVGSFVTATWDKNALSRKTLSSWLFSVFLILLGFYLSLWMSQFMWWQEASYASYNAIQRFTSPTTTLPSHTAVVLIDDDDFWRGEWARREPLKRTTLAKLLRAIKDANPRVIGVDVDLRCQTPDGRVEMHDDYLAETKELFDTVDQIAKTVPVVLAKTVGFDEQKARFVRDADLFDKVPFVNQKHITAGYTRLPHDLRQVALNSAAAGITLESFASAISHVDQIFVGMATKRGGGSLPYVRSFLGRASFNEACVSAGRIMSGDNAAKSALASKIVIIGGDWHRDAWGRGDRVDEHRTPQGNMPGALIHANYVEAVLSQQTTAPSSEWLHLLFEFAVGLGLVSVFVCGIGYWKLLYLLLLSVVICFASVVAWANVGIFLDAAPPLILLGAHTAVENVLDWKRKAAAYDARFGD